ncbi:MAG: hypothetical protein LBD51_09630, partial [Bifidobacteriaceae bacterium]|nr:hypothetical protein [Bifidobacteriaceae bacterium]
MGASPEPTSQAGPSRSGLLGRFKAVRHARQPQARPPRPPQPARPTRPPSRALKPIALVTAAVVALGGLTLAQGIGSADQARAVSYLNGWNGKFEKNQLWLLNHLNYFRPESITDPGNVAAADFSAAWQMSMNIREDGTGTTCSLLDYFNIAVGPLMARRGNQALMGLVTANGMDHGMVIYGSECFRTGNVLPSAAAYSTSYGGEINQRNGLLYTVHGATTS